MQSPPSMPLPPQPVRRLPPTFGSAAAAFLLVCAAALQARAPQPGQNGSQNSDHDLSGPVPRSVILETVDNELKLIDYDRVYLRYRVHIRDTKGDRIRDVLESKDGTVARVILRDDRPISPDEDAAEHQRLQEMLDSPDAFHKHIDKDREGKRLARNLIKELPDAMIFTYTPGQPQRGSKPSYAPAEHVVDFHPDPHWNPPNMTAQALTGVAGRCWIDPRTHFMTRMEVSVFQPVNFGWGALAKIFPGGKLDAEQVPVAGENRWVVDHFDEHVTVRALMVKTIKVDTILEAGDFTTVPAMDYKQAIQTLLNTPLPIGSTIARR